MLQTDTKEVFLLRVKMLSDMFGTSALNSLGFL